MNPCSEYRAGPSVLVLLVSAVIIIAFLPVPAAATPPSSVTPSYNERTSALDVTIDHTVYGNPSHFIRHITVRVNGHVVDETEYTSQQSGIFTVTSTRALRPGDTVEVTAECSLSGTGSGKFIMPGPTATAETRGTVPAAAPTRKSPLPVLLTFAGTAGALAVRIKNRYRERGTFPGSRACRVPGY